MAITEGQVQIRDLILGPGTAYDLPGFNAFRNSVRADQSGPRAWNHGSWSGAEWADEVAIDMSIVVVGEGMPGWAEANDALAAALAPVGAAAEDVEMRYVLGGREYLRWVRPRVYEPDSVMLNTGIMATQAGLVALDPLRYSGEESTAVLGLPVFRGGLTVPFTVPFTVDARRVGMFAWAGTPHGSASTMTLSDGTVHTNLVTNPRGRNASGTAVVRENLCTNPSMEVDGSDWSPNAQGGHTGAVSTDEAWAGSQSFLVTVGSDGPNLAARYRLPDPGIPAGMALTVSCYAKVAPGTPEPDAADLLYRDDLTGSTYATEPATLTDAGGGWWRISHTHTVPTSLSLTSVYFRLRNSGDGWLAGQQAYFDACLIEVGTTPGPYFDGDTSPDPDLTPAWTGTAGASTSQLTAPSPVGIAAPTGGVVYYSAKHDATAIFNRGETNCTAQENMGFTTGDLGTFVVEFFSTESGTVRLRTGGQVVDVGNTDDTLPAGQWYTLRRGFESTGGAAAFYAYNSLPAGSTVYVRRALIDGTDTYDGPWFDGDSEAGDFPGLAGPGVLVNEGTTDTPLRLRIDGPVVQPRIVLLRPDGEDQALRFDTTLQAGQWLDIDTGARTVLLQGQTSRRAQTAGEFPLLPPGRSTLRFFTGEHNDDAEVTAVWRSAWW